MTEEQGSNPDDLLFSTPQDDDIIWRYMSFTKLVSLLDSSSLFFCRSDLFEDKFEGSYGKFNQQNRETVYRGKIPEAALLKSSEMNKHMRKFTYINCWHINQYESEAMWKIYSKGGDGIAITSTYGKLRKHIPDNFKIYKVNYLDYNSQWVPELSMFYPFFHKRLSFEHERELRAVYIDFDTLKKCNGTHKITPASGINVTLNIRDIIDKIYISPTSRQWFSTLVRKLIEKYAFSFPIHFSELDDDPCF